MNLMNSILRINQQLNKYQLLIKDQELLESLGKEFIKIQMDFSIYHLVIINLKLTLKDLSIMCLEKIKFIQIFQLKRT